MTIELQQVAIEKVNFLLQEVGNLKVPQGEEIRKCLFEVRESIHSTLDFETLSVHAATLLLMENTIKRAKNIASESN